MMETFGDRLRYHRKNTRDPHQGVYLTQQRLAELISQRLGTQDSPQPQMVSYWEHT